MPGNFIFYSLMAKKRVAINGFGRIGRAVARLLLTEYKDKFELVAINDPAPIETTAHLFEFDSNYGRFELPIEIKGTNLAVGGKEITCFSTREISELPWGDHDIEVVFECTGVFRKADQCQLHIDQGAQKVVLSAPCKSDGFRNIVMGVNDDELESDDLLVSNASCTTNCLAPVVKAIDEAFGIESGLMTTIHSYTNDQRILDVGHKDLRRARAAALNMIPTTTGAAKAVGLVYPKVSGKMTGFAVRVPTPTVSLVDVTFKVGKSTSAEEVNDVLKKASDKMPHVLGFETKPVVSMDFKGDPRSSIVDAAQTMVIDDLVKIVAWYDNEWGYSCRIVELAAEM